MSKKNGATRKINIEVTKIVCDPVQYKPYSPEFTPADGLVVQVEVPQELVIEEDNVLEDGLVAGTMVVGPEGFQYIAEFLSNMIEDMHHDRQERQARKRTTGRKYDD